MRSMLLLCSAFSASSLSGVYPWASFCDGVCLWFVSVQLPDSFSVSFRPCFVLKLMLAWSVCYAAFSFCFFAD